MPRYQRIDGKLDCNLLAKKGFHMARTAASATATTLYRLTGVTELKVAIRDKYLEGSAKFARVECAVGERTALLVHGHMETPRARWADRLSALIDVPFDASNQNSAAVLLVEGEDSTAWAVAYGMGFHLLDQAYVDPGFGQRVAIRVAHADNLNSLTSKTMDSRAKVDRSSIPSGSQLSGFGLGDFGELVTRVVATAEMAGLTVGKTFKLRGADALNLPLAHTPSNFLADLAVVEETLKKPPLKELQVLEQLVAIKKDSPTATALDGLLQNALLADPPEKFGVAWPHEGINENGTPAAFKVKGRGERNPYDGVPTVEAIRQALDPQDVLGSLSRIKIQLFSDPDAQNPISADVPLRKWVAFEETLDNRRYFLHDGLWYLIDENYAAQLQDRVSEIFGRVTDLTLPPWQLKNGKMISEEKYNKIAAKAIGGVVLDRKLVTTVQNRRGFEACDVLAPDGALVHVKKADGSAPLSHLFAQGHNSAHSLVHDNEARTKFRKLVEKQGGNPDLVKDKPATVIFAIARSAGQKFGPDSLYSFSQVTLVRTVDDLAARGISVYVVPIENDAATSETPA